MLKLDPKTHQTIYFIGLCAMVIGLPLSAFLMGSSQFLIAGNWLLEGNFKTKWNKFIHNKTALVLTSLFLAHVLGGVYSNDFTSTLQDLKIKLPLLLLPFLFSTIEPLSKKKFIWLISIFIFAVFCGTFVSTGVYYGRIQTRKPIVDIRDISIFISHIRFSLLICMSIFLLTYLIIKNKNWLVRFAFSILIIWFFLFLVLLESITGIAILYVVGIVLLLSLIFILKTKKQKIACAVTTFVFIVAPALYIQQLKHEFSFVENVNFSNLEKTTSHGENYAHDTTANQTENGHYLWIYIAPKELENTWNSRSKIIYSGRDKKGNEIRWTVIRYITSKGLRKDADGVNTLTEDDIKAIENGTANIYYTNSWSLKGRIHQILWEYNEYKQTGQISGHSATQRLRFWETALQIIKANPLIGVGTGDVQNEFNNYYTNSNSELNKENRLHSHNQYLTITVALGLIGLCWFLFTLVYPVFKEKTYFNYFYMTFLLIALLSFINEDTLETQAGVMFFSFFNSFYLFLSPKEEAIN